MNKHTRFVGAALLAALAGTALAGSESGLAAVKDLQQQFPGVHTYQDGARTRIIYGVPMNTAATPQAAAQQFLAQHGDAFGVGQLDLVEQWSGDVNFGKFFEFSYTQRVGGLPVELSPGRLLVRNNLDGSWSVVYAAGLFAHAPAGGFPAMTRTAQDALNFVKASEFGALPKWSSPELVAYQLDTGAGFEAVRAWKFVGENPDLVNREKYTFFVDAATGGLLEARNEVHNIDVFGYVKGYASPGLLPDEGSNPPQILPINDATVSVSGGNSGYSDKTGLFTITNGGSGNVTISANLDTGHWSNINDQSGTAVLSASATATPGVEAYLEFNSSPSQYKTAQVNAFMATGLIHDFIRERTSWTGMDFRCTTNVNLNQTCNAYFDGSSINFFRAGGGCNNTAYTTVVSHEYGHYIVSKQGLAQGSFGEGFGDCCSELLYDTGRVGEHFFTNGGYIRDNDNTIVKYPCGGEIHTCGQVLGGVWWHMRENFGATYGSGPGLDMIRQMFVDWTIVTTGGSGNDGAHPGTAIEVLTLDDDDGNINNGTPNYDEIKAAFNLHNISVPDIVPFIFLYPDGLPQLVSPAGGTSFHVQLVPNSGFQSVPGSGTLHIDTGSGYTDVPMQEISSNYYLATVPAADCLSNVHYYLSAMSTDGAQGQDPQDAPADSYLTYAAEGRTLIVSADFESDAGFTVVNENVDNGGWGRTRPSGTGSPGGDYDGSGKAFNTSGVVFNSDLDGGPTHLLSPVYDLSGTSDPVLSYARWFYVDNNDGDRLVVEASSDGGATWTTLESLASTGKAWFVPNFHLKDYIALTNNVRIRFSDSDNPDNSTNEAAIDAFLIQEVDCGGCVADFNGDGNVNTQDVLAFLNAWNTGDSRADINGDGSVNTQDVLAYLNLWNVGC
ncbi:MAG: hypothetical protein IPJ41_01630 [Phycisphaerales bacterium]|nr:hypothetical protein [Phycisphaerales bacterium]